MLINTSLAYAKFSTLESQIIFKSFNAIMILRGIGNNVFWQISVLTIPPVFILQLSACYHTEAKSIREMLLTCKFAGPFIHFSQFYLILLI